MIDDKEKKIEFQLDGKVHTAFITAYCFGTENMAIQTFDETNLPHCRLSTNPGWALDEGVIAIRDDEQHVIPTRDALIKAGIIELYKDGIHIPIGWVTATLYQVMYTESDESSE